MTTWRDAHDLKLAFCCMREVEPVNYRSIVLACRTSRRLRKAILKKARAMLAFSLRKALYS